MAAELALDEGRSDREVARRTGAVPQTVGKIRRELESAGTLVPSPVQLGHDGRRRPTTRVAASRRPGELPAAGLGELVGDVRALLAPRRRRQQRQVTTYLQRLAIPLAGLSDLDGWTTPAEVADACILILGRERADDLATTLGNQAQQVVQVAVAIRKEVAGGSSA